MEFWTFLTFVFPLTAGVLASLGLLVTELDSEVRLTGVGWSPLDPTCDPTWDPTWEPAPLSPLSRLTGFFCLGLLCSLRASSFLTAWGLAAPEEKTISLSQPLNLHTEQQHLRSKYLT